MRKSFITSGPGSCSLYFASRHSEKVAAKDEGPIYRGDHI